jgi:hypothetical protein
VKPQRAFEKIERAIEADVVARIFDTPAGMADRRAIAPQGLT